MTRKMNNVIDPDWRVLLSQSQMPALVSSEMVAGWEAREAIAHWAMGHGLASPGPRGRRCIATFNDHRARADAVVVMVESQLIIAACLFGALPVLPFTTGRVTGQPAINTSTSTSTSRSSRVESSRIRPPDAVL